MSRQIIVLSGETNQSGKVRFTCAFWIARSVGTVTWRPPQTSSVVKTATPAELAALASGAVLEVTYTTNWYFLSGGTTAVRAEVQSAYAQRAASVTTEENVSDQFGGWFWDGTTWAAPDPFTPPAATPSVQTTHRFTASNPVAGVAHGTAITTTPPFTLHNPVGSGVVLRIIETRVGRISGTLGAGNVVYTSTSQATAPTGGTVLTPACALTGYSAVSKALAYQGSLLAATPSLLRPSIALNGNPTGVQLIRDCVDGTLDVLPGSALSLLHVGTAGTTPLVMFCAVWDEVPI